MKNYLKSVSFAALATANLVSFSAQAEVPLFNFTLTVQDVSNPQIFLGKDKKAIQASGPNTFEVDVRKSDYVFLVQYQHDGQTKEAICPISGAPTLVTAIINPQKTGLDACTTEELKREKAIVSL